MTDTSPDNSFKSVERSAGASVARRTVLAGSALAVPAIAMTVATPASAASNAADLAFTYFALQVPAQYNGRPVYGSGNQPFLDFAMQNLGTGPTGSTALQLDFDSAYVTAVTPPDGWTITNSYMNGSRFVTLMYYAGGGLPANGTVTGRVVFTVNENAPSGVNEQTVNGLIYPLTGDSNQSNNARSATFYVSQGKQPDLTFTYFALQVTGVYNGRPLYGAGNRPFLDLAIQNSGAVSTPNTSVQLDFDTAWVEDITAPDGWTIASTRTDGSRLVAVMNYTAGGLAPNAGATARVLFTVKENAPGGTNQQYVGATALPTDGDATPNNNTTSATFYVTGTQFNLGFSYFALQSSGLPQEQGRPLYGPNNGPFIDAVIQNSGSAAAPYVQMQFDFDATQAASMSPPSGWSLSRTWRDGSRIVFLFAWNGGALPNGQTAGGRFVWQTTSRPAGDVYERLQGTVTARAIPSDGDSNTSNNATSATFFTRN